MALTLIWMKFGEGYWAQSPYHPSRKFFFEVGREENKRKVMLQHPSDLVLPHQNSALVSVKQEEFFTRNQVKEKVWCNHCTRPSHTKENCWKIHGKPANWKPRPKKDNPRSAYNAEALTENKPTLNLSGDQNQALCKLLNQGTAQPSTNNPQSTASLALQGNLQHYSLVSKHFSKNIWVIDIGA